MPEPRRAIRFWAGWWLVCFALWLLLTSTVALNDVLTGVAAAAVAATAAAASRVDRPGEARTVPGALQYLVALPGRIAADTALLARALVRPGSVHGRYLDVTATGSGPAFETAATILVSASPNHFVVDFDDSTGMVTLHELVRRDHASVEEVMLRP